MSNVQGMPPGYCRHGVPTQLTNSSCKKCEREAMSDVVERLTALLIGYPDRDEEQETIVTAKYEIERLRGLLREAERRLSAGAEYWIDPRGVMHHKDPLLKEISAALDAADQPTDVRRELWDSMVDAVRCFACDHPDDEAWLTEDGKWHCAKCGKDIDD